MSEHKFKVGDKVIVNGHNAEITNATYADNIPYRVRFDNGVMGWYEESELKPVSDHLTADEIAELIASTPTERDDIKKLDEESDYIANMMEEVTGYNKGYKIGFKDGYDAHCKEIAQAGIDVMHSEYKRGWRECRAKMMEFISKDYQDDFK